VDEFRRVEPQPQGDEPAGGMADDVGTLDAEVPQQSAVVGRLLGQTASQEATASRRALARPRIDRHNGVLNGAAAVPERKTSTPSSSSLA
jgi:hypothetical protein